MRHVGLVECANERTSRRHQIDMCIHSRSAVEISVTVSAHQNLPSSETPTYLHSDISSWTTRKLTLFVIPCLLPQSRSSWSLPTPRSTSPPTPTATSSSVKPRSVPRLSPSAHSHRLTSDSTFQLLQLEDNSSAAQIAAAQQVAASQSAAQASLASGGFGPDHPQTLEDLLREAEGGDEEG